MCPPADRPRDSEYSRPPFSMTTIVPQAPGNNQGPWREVEEYCRSLVRDGQELYIVCGPAGARSRIGRAKVLIPESTWKVVVALPEQDGDDVARIDAQTRVIAIWVPNNDDVRDTPWEPFATTIDQIEQQTSLDLLSNLSPDIQKALQ